MKIVFIVLGHQNPAILARLISAITLAGHKIVLHYDKKSNDSDFVGLRSQFEANYAVRFAKRERVRWGEWSVCKATLNCLDEIKAVGWNPDYVYYASGADYPIRSSEELVSFLERNRGKEFIEGVQTNKKSWVKGGPEKERYQYRFYTNWRDYPKLSKGIMKIQQFLGLKRRFVLGLEPHMGSQWWVLTWTTLQKVMELASRKDVQRFFSTTMIPDELFFQTLVCNLLPSSRIVARPLTLYQFTDYMVPIIFCLDRVEYLIRQPFFMARKLSPHRMEMFDELDKVWFGHSAAATFSDQMAAVVGPDYEENRLRYRDGMPGVPVYGKAVQKWYEDLGRLEESYFAVIGLSTAELKIAFLILSCSKKVICHGQIFHPDCIEFAQMANEFAGYTSTSLKLRNMSAPNFVANLVRAAPDKTTGFLIRSGQGWHVPEIMFDRPAPRAFLVWGDPLIAFAESLSDHIPKLNDRIQWNLVEAMPASVLVRKWSTFMSGFSKQLEKLDGLVNYGIAKKRTHNWNWLTEVDLDVSKSSRLPRPNVIRHRSNLSGWGEITLQRWRDWSMPAGRNLGIHFASVVPPATWQEIITIIAGLEAGRRLIIDSLAAGGLVLDSALDPPGNDAPPVALPLVLSPQNRAHVTGIKQRAASGHDTKGVHHA